MIQFHLDLVQLLGLVSGVILPLIVALVTAKVTSSGLKAILLAVLSIAVSLITEISGALSAHTAYNLGTALVAALGTFLIAVGIHYGLWKPTTVSDKLQAVGFKGSKS